MELIHSNVPLLIVGATLGAGAAGFLKIAINFTNILAKPIALLNQAIFPELSKIEAGAGSGRSEMLRVCARGRSAGRSSLRRQSLRCSHSSAANSPSLSPGRSFSPPRH